MPVHAAIAPQICDLAVTLTLTPRPSKSDQFICILIYIINQSLLKFCPLVWYEILYQQTTGGTLSCMHAFTNAQSVNIMHLTHLSVGRGQTLCRQ